ncbi:MAG TPA: hypothetical protein VGP82_05195 [Ktedonobacterales bacterium]|nr:hypothetical protein [Ktedonobacterales bacterium]
MSKQRTTFTNPPAVLIRRYRNERAYERDAQQLAHYGYRATNVIKQPRKYKIWEIICTAGLVKINPLHQTDLMVTYNRG